MDRKRAAIVGAGPVGCLLAIYLHRLGYAVEVFEKRNEAAVLHAHGTGRSINIALSTRGLTALAHAQVLDKIQPGLTPVFGRQMHHADGSEAFQAYSTDLLAIYSVSRAYVNAQLAAEVLRLHIPIQFNTPIEHVQETIGEKFDFCIATDGLHSSVRKFVDPEAKINRFSHGYTELTLPQGSDLGMHALHIWPEKDSMLIALPNSDGSFTCTLFYPLHWFEGATSASFPAALEAILLDKYSVFYQKYKENIASDVQKAKPSVLESILCHEWVGELGACPTLLLSDAAHGVLPFYGQGMNAGFEDVRLLAEFVQRHGVSVERLREFATVRMPDMEALHQFVLENFYDMKGDITFSAAYRKKMEAMLTKKAENPYEFKTRYEWVSFSNLPYSEICIKERKIESELEL